MMHLPKGKIVGSGLRTRVIELGKVNWGAGMTVCIAAPHFQGDDKKGESIFCITDTMLSTGDMSADLAARKIQRITKGWNAMYSGDDVSYVTPISEYVGSRIAENNRSLGSVTKAFVDAYRAQLNKKAETEVLTPIGYTLDEFKKDGFSQLGSDSFTRLLYEIQQQTIDLSFLVAGFDEGDAHIFTVTSPGVINYYSELGFWAIGSGQTHALGSLFNATKRLRFLSKDEVLYRICEAKFNAENALGVGRTTVINVIEENGDNRWIFDAEDLRPVWQATRVVNVPPEGKKISNRILGARSEVPSKPDSSRTLLPKP